MKALIKLAKIGHKSVYGKRCDIRPGIYYFDEKHYQGLHKESFEFKNHNQITLRGGYYFYDNYKKDTLVIFCHGMGGGHQAYMNEINYIAKAGFKVLSFDYQGTILSDGDDLGGFCQSLSDVDRCLDIVENHYSNIYVVGHSWGGWTAGCSTYLHPKIKKVVILSGINSIQDVFKQYVKWYLAFLRRSICKVEIKKYPKYADISLIKSLNRKDLSSLVIQSKDDKIVRYDYNFEKLKRMVNNPNCEFISEKDKNHNPEYTTEAVKYLVYYLHQLNHCKTIDELNRLYKTANWDKMCELDTKVMNKIIDFLNK